MRYLSLATLTQDMQSKTETSYTRKKDKSKVRPCPFCTHHATYIDYKRVGMLKEYIDGLMRILPRRKTGVCPKHQRMLAMAIKRARLIALLPV